jgi:integrase
MAPTAIRSIDVALAHTMAGFRYGYDRYLHSTLSLEIQRAKNDVMIAIHNDSGHVGRQIGVHNLDIRFHDLRHTAATLMLQQGIHPKVVQERLGHSAISLTLDTYSHVLPSMQEEAAKAMDELLTPIPVDV